MCFLFSVRAVITTVKSVKYIWKGLQTLFQGKIEVPVLDATAIGVSIIRGDFATAGSVMYLLGIGETLEEWTHKKSAVSKALEFLNGNYAPVLVRFKRKNAGSLRGDGV